MIDSWMVMRESECGGCSECGRNLSQWEHGISMEEALAAIAADPDLLEPMLIRRCPSCGTVYDWEVLVVSEDREDDWPFLEEARSSLLAALRASAGGQCDPFAAAREVSRAYGIEGIYIEDGSEVARRLWRPQAVRRSERDG